MERRSLVRPEIVKIQPARTNNRKTARPKIIFQSKRNNLEYHYGIKRPERNRNSRLRRDIGFFRTIGYEFMSATTSLFDVRRSSFGKFKCPPPARLSLS
jgi:hypothetical protein